MTRIDRPWGRMWLLFRATRLWVKVIRVDPGHRTSLQYHLCRSELHIGLDKWCWRLVRPHDRHCMAGGLYLEIAWGRPTEADIVRVFDFYGRA